MLWYSGRARRVCQTKEYAARGKGQRTERATQRAHHACVVRGVAAAQGAVQTGFGLSSIRLCLSHALTNSSCSGSS